LAAGADDWTVFDGFACDLIPHTVTSTADGIVINSPKGYYTGYANSAGVAYNNPVNPDNFSIELTIDKIADDDNTADTWFTVSLLNKKTYFDTQNNTDQGAGYVSLIRVLKEKINVQLFNHSNPAEPFKGAGSKDPFFEGDPVGKTLTITVEKVSNGKYSFKIDGTEIDQLDLGDVYKDKEVFLIIGASNNKDREMQVTVKKINGQSMADTSAADWTIFPGYVGTKVPHTVKQVSNGIQINSQKGYYTGYANSAGVAYNNPVNPDNFSVKFTIDKIADEDGSADTWFTISLLNKKTYFDTTNATDRGAGYVSLIRALKDKINVQLFNHVSGNPFQFAGSKEPFYEGDPVGKTFTLTVTKVDDNGNYSLKIDDTEIAQLNVGESYKDTDVYLIVGMSNNKDREMQITINEINGTTLGTGEPTEEPTEEPTPTPTPTPAPTDEPAATDSGSNTALYVILACVGVVIIAGVVVLLVANKKKKASE